MGICARLVSVTVTSVVVLSAAVAVSAAERPRPRRLTLDDGSRLSYPASWTATRPYTNAQKLVQFPPDEEGEDAHRPSRILITTESMRSHAEAVKRLLEIAAEEAAPATYLAIGGWPALERQLAAPRPRPESEEQERRGEMLLRMTTAVAIENRVVRLEAAFPLERRAKLEGEVREICRSLITRAQATPEETQAEIESLRAAPDLRTRPTPAPRPYDEQASFPRRRDFGAPQRVLTGASELEVAAANNGQTVVVATNGGIAYSTNGGVTFSVGALNFPPGYFRIDGDPSLAVGRSGTIYYGGIGFPTSGTNSTTIWSSTNQGQTFNRIAEAVTCPNFPTSGPPNPAACFADQEHIGADRFNAGPGNADQVYSTWRDFDNTDQDPAIVCSQNGGVSWTPKAVVDTGSFIPRITVGQDGFVYVVYRQGGNIRINKYSQCQSGLVAQAGFPRTVTAVTDVPCPVAGLDRCNDGNNLSSVTVAVDDTNANHVYVAYSTSTGGGNENVVVRDSTDGGMSFPRSVNINSAVTGRRFMPWVCAVGGVAHVSWYDRRFAIATVSDDATDFYRGSAFVSGPSLVAGAEVRLTTTSDAHCATGWPCGSRATGDSESCPGQPQLAGFCKVPAPPSPDPSSNNRCDYSDGGCPTGPPPETCSTSGGCPKYGDYNGDACGFGRVYTAWASATPPAGITPTGNIDTFFNRDTVCCVPEIQAPTSAPFADTCAGDTANGTLHVCNTGFVNLNVTGISSSNTQFKATGAFPVAIPASACHDFPLEFTPASRGAKSATFTVMSNDLVRPAVAVSATGVGKGIVSITCPADVTKDNDPGLCSAVVNPGTPTYDAEGCPVNVSGVRSDALALGAPYPVGTTTIQWTATDGGGNQKACTQTIVVEDAEPPVISGAGAVPNSLWPPNHKMVNVTVNYTVTDNCDAVGLLSCSLGVTSNEPVNGTGDGDTAPDWEIVDSHHLRLRAERKGNGNGRVYTIEITCKDTKDNTSSTQTFVQVPHNPH